MVSIKQFSNLWRLALALCAVDANGQQGWYTPGVAGTIGQFIYTYADNARGLSANPAGGAQFLGGRSDGGTALARAQHDFDFSTATTWTLTFD